MPKDILSMIGKPKPIKSHSPTDGTKKLLLETLSQNTKSRKTHTTTIVDQYLIKLQPTNTVSDSSKIIALDLDGTLVTTKSGSKFARSPEDWKWFNDKVVERLIGVQHPIVIFTNQGAVIGSKTAKSYINFTKRIANILEELQRNGVDVGKVWVYASPKKPANYKITKNEGLFVKMRKPEIGMLEEFKKDYSHAIIAKDSLFIGDAAGRKKDFSDSDLQFAQNCGFQFKTPEEYFE